MLPLFKTALFHWTKFHLLLIFHSWKKVRVCTRGYYFLFPNYFYFLYPLHFWEVAFQFCNPLHSTIKFCR